MQRAIALSRNVRQHLLSTYTQFLEKGSMARCSRYSESDKYLRVLTVVQATLKHGLLSRRTVAVKTLHVPESISSSVRLHTSSLTVSMMTLYVRMQLICLWR